MCEVCVIGVHARVPNNDQSLMARESCHVSNPDHYIKLQLMISGLGSHTKISRCINVIMYVHMILFQFSVPSTYYYQISGLQGTP